MGNNIILLTSCHKSGLSWFRGFLTALQNDGIFSDKGYVENILDLSVDVLSSRELINYRKLAFIYIAKESAKSSFVKIQDSYTYSRWDGLPLIPSFGSRLALYFIRNPLDVVLSLANHIGLNIEETIYKYMNCEESVFVKKSKIKQQYYQLLGTWAIHTSSGIDQKNISVHVIRYEDLEEDPFATFKEAALQMQFNYDDNHM